MKAPLEDLTIEGVCQLLCRSRLLTTGEVDDLQQRWQREAGERPVLADFSHWLVARQYVTEYQMALLLHGHTDHFFLGDYKLLERIGRGRLAMVYRAVNRVGTIVALKVLPPSRARDPQALVRFQREARLGARLEHSNVVRVIGAGEDAGLHYLIMEYLEGETLHDALALSGRLKVADAAAIAVQALAGLQHFHERGLVHRNVEPANLMLVGCPGANRGYEGNDMPLVKLLDISLCRAVDEEDPVPEGINRSRLSYEGLMLAAPAYLAPELARDPHAADIRADVFSLGCVLYHALAGRPPFTDTSKLRQMIRNATETAPLLDQVNPEVPAELARLVGRMMARDPAERYQTPRESARALEPFLARSNVTTLDVELVAWPASPPPAVAQPISPVQAVPPSIPEPEPERSEAPSFAEAALAFSATSPRPATDALPDFSPPALRESRQGLSSGQTLLLLLIGAVGLLLVQALSWLLALLLRTQ